MHAGQTFWKPRDFRGTKGCLSISTIRTNPRPPPPNAPLRERYGAHAQILPVILEIPSLLAERRMSRSPRSCYSI